MFVAPFGFKSFGLDIEPMGDATDEEYFEFGDGVIRGYSDDGPKDLVIPSKIDGKKVTEIGSGAFRYNKLESVDIPDSVTKIGSEAFRDNNLASVDIPDSVTEIGSYAFRDNKLESVDIPDSVTEIGIFAFRDNKLESVDIPDSVTEIGSNAFSYNNLESVDIPDSVTEIGSYAFSNNYLTSVDIPDSVTEIKSGVFQDNHLESVDIPDSVTEIGIGLFRYNHLESVDIPDSVTEIGSYAFRDNHLESVDIPDSVTEIGSGAFQDNDLTSVDIPDSVTEIGSGAFHDNDLTSVDIPDSVTEIGSGAFQDNDLTSVDIPDSVTEIGNGAFSNNYLTSVDISDSVTKIGSYAFQNNNLTKFIVPTNVEELGYGAISDNDDLKEIFLLPVNITFTKFSNMTPFTGTPDDLVLFGIPESDIDDDGTKTILEDFAEKEEIELRPLLGTINPNGTKKWESDLKLRINDFKEIIDINNFRCTYQKVNINGEYGSCSTDKPLIFEDPGRYTVTLEGEVNDHDLVYKSEEFKFDNAGPNIKLDGSEEVISSEEEEIEITVKDEHSGLAKVEYTWTDNKDENINEADYDNKRNFNGEIESEIIFTNIPEEIGVHYLHVRAIDEVGNVNKQYFKTERIGTFEIGRNSVV